MEKNQEFWQFSDQLRLETGGFANLSLNDSIWTPKRPEDRRNFDSRSLSGAPSSFPSAPKPKSSDFNPFNDGWKTHLGLSAGLDRSFNNNGVFFNKKDPASPSVSPSPSPSPSPFLKGPLDKNFNNGVFIKDKEPPFIRGSNKKFGKYSNNIKHGEAGENRKNHNNNSNSNVKNSNNNNNNNSVDKRFKTLPAAEALPRNEAIGGYIFVCNNDTMQENLRRQLFGLPPRYRDSVRAITPGLPLFLYNYSTHQLHGVFEAASFGGTNIDPTAWEDKKCPGESRFPAQVRVVTRKNCEPLEEDSFRPILHHYDGPKFRLEINVPEALALLDKFDDSNSL